MQADRAEKEAAYRLLDQAQRGDRAAQAAVVAFCSKEYAYRVRRFYTSDPGLDRDDIDQEFMEGIFRGIARDKGLGDRLYYLGQCGVWAVQSMVRSARMSRHGALEGGVFVLSLEEYEANSHGEDEQTTYIAIDPEAHFVFESVIESEISRQRINRILANCALSPGLQRALDLIMSGAAGDPSEAGLGKRLSDLLGVTPQRASQILAKLHDRFAEADCVSAEAA